MRKISEVFEGNSIIIVSCEDSRMMFGDKILKNMLIGLKHIILTFWQNCKNVSLSNFKIGPIN